MVVIPLSETSAFVIESRRPLGNDNYATDSGVLVYHVDSSVRTGRGPLYVVHGNPELRDTYDPDDVNTACLGLNENKFATFDDPTSGVSVTVISQSEVEDVVLVKRSDQAVSL
ncbi:hypothetical protein [Alicyclobacillus fastidiosus]|nr:hypothetical protein [Alicyclobacillus fastidiosus]